jgi:hypothetical protein
MAVLRPGRFRDRPGQYRELRTGHAGLAAAVEGGFAGLIQMPPARVGDQTRDRCVALGLTRQCAGGVAGAPGIPRAGVVFSAAEGIAAGYTEVVDA